MTNPTIPSNSPAGEGQMGVTLRDILRKALQRVDGQLPARVVSYDRASNIAQVQPLICLITTAGQQIPRAPIAAVPVLAIGGGGYMMNFPLVKGNTGWIHASDRDISLYLQSGDVQPPNTLRMHSFEDGLFVPDVMATYSIDGTDADAMVIQSLTGSEKIVIGPGRIHLKAATIEIEGDTIIINGQTVTMTAATTTMNGPVGMPDGATIGGIPFGTHVHPGVETGGGETEPPI